VVDLCLKQKYLVADFGSPSPYKFIVSKTGLNYNRILAVGVGRIEPSKPATQSTISVILTYRCLYAIYKYMQTTVRTTIRIRQDLFDQSRLLAFKKGTSLQDVINEGLAIGYKHITDLNLAKQSMRQIDTFRERMKNKNIDLKNLLEASKNEQK